MRTVIFDFDGTLADTVDLIHFCFERIFEEFENRKITKEDIKWLFGPSAQRIIDENFSPENVEKATKRFFELYENEHVRMVKPSKEIQEMLKYLKSNNYKIGLFTGKGERSLKISLEKLNIPHIFDVIITGDDVEKVKPDPEGIFKALKALNSTKEDTMMIGDSNKDVVAGKEAGIFTIAVQWLSGYQDAEYDVEPDRIFRSIGEFKSFLESM